MIIDFHSHFVPPSFPAKPESIIEPAWPRLSPFEGGATLFVGETKFRDFDSMYWDVGERLRAMDASGVDMHVISPLPELFSYWLGPQAGAVITDSVNEQGANIAARSGGRIKAMGIVAMQDVDYAARQVGRIAELGLCGIFLGSHVNGKSIASEQFYPVWAKAERHGIPLFIHGIKPAGLDRIEGPGLMGAVVGIPYEGTMALAGFIATDIFARFPKLQIVFAHGGGMIASVIDRMELIWTKFPGPMQATLKERPTEYAKRFWYDTVVFSPQHLRYLAARFGADRILAGSDGPTEIGQTDLPRFVAAAGLSEADNAAILGGNAARLLETTQ